MSPAVRNYLNLKRRYRALLDQRAELAAEIRDAEVILADIEACFSREESREWRALGMPEESRVKEIANVG